MLTYDMQLQNEKKLKAQPKIIPKIIQTIK